MFDKLIDILKANPRRIVFTEGSDARILEAASRLKKSTGVRKPSFFRRSAASRIRASGPSVKTILRGFALRISIKRSNMNRSSSMIGPAPAFQLVEKTLWAFPPS